MSLKINLCKFPELNIEQHIQQMDIFECLKMKFILSRGSEDVNFDQV